MFRQDREIAYDRGEFLVVLLVEAEGHFAITGLFRSGHMAIVTGIKGTVLFEHIQAEDDVFRGHRLTVSPFGFRPQSEGYGRHVVRVGNGFSQ
ncbi:hypothetical protein D3C87_1935540 [compost metagenome]